MTTAKMPGSLLNGYGSIIFHSSLFRFNGSCRVFVYYYIIVSGHNNRSAIIFTDMKKQLHNLRERYRWLLRDEVAHTVENPADIEDEIRHLCGALAAATE